MVLEIFEERWPVMRQSVLIKIPKRIRACRIADNQRSARATWGADFLRFHLNDLEMNNFDLRLIGFDLDQLESCAIAYDLEAAPPATNGSLFMSPPLL